MNIKQLDYHRNGVSGLGFHVAIAEVDGKDMLIIRFPKECDAEAGGILCACFELSQLDKREIRFLYNSWRGDYYSGMMDKAIELNRLCEVLS